MMKNNLLKNDLKIYEIQSTEREVYETEFCFQLKVMDSANVIEGIADEYGADEDDVIKTMYDKMKNYALYHILDQTVDPNHYDVKVKIEDYPGTRAAEVRLSKRRVRERVRNGIKKFLSEKVG